MAKRTESRSLALTGSCRSSSRIPCASGLQGSSAAMRSRSTSSVRRAPRLRLHHGARTLGESRFVLLRSGRTRFAIASLPGAVDSGLRAPLRPLAAQDRTSLILKGTKTGCCPTTRWSRPGQPGVGFSAILALAGRAAHLEAVGQPSLVKGPLFLPAPPRLSFGESSIETFPTSLAAPVGFNALLRPKEAQQALLAGGGFAAQ
jgi:hypothetical protein